MSALAGFHHVKLPVSNVERSRAWYQLVDRVPHIDFVEGGVLMGVPMRSADGSLVLALRRDSVRAAALAGFDPFALATHPLGPAEVAGSVGQARRAARRHRCGPYRLGDRRARDPDGIEIRLYTVERYDGRRTTRARCGSRSGQIGALA